MEGSDYCSFHARIMFHEQEVERAAPRDARQDLIDERQQQQQPQQQQEWEPAEIEAEPVEKEPEPEEESFEDEYSQSSIEQE